MIIFINGSINSGKSTVASLLSTILPRTAHIEVDDLHNFVKWIPLQSAIPLNLENAASLINNFSARGISSIISYPLSKEDLEYILGKLNEREEYMFFTLDPGIEIALTNRGARELTAWETERIKYHYKSGINNPGFGIIVNNSTQSPQQTAEEIISHLGSDKSKE